MDNKILCIGELLIDFVCSDVNAGLHEGTNFIKKAGGAPANVAVTICKLGEKAIFAGKVGKDAFGVFLKNILVQEGVDTSMLVMDPNVKTTLAFVSLKTNGERDFIFNRGADELLKYEELKDKEIKHNKIIHFGSATALLGGDLKETYFKVMKMAKRENLFISFDPNYRVDLWKNRDDEFVRTSKECIEYADFVKVSEEELRIISRQENLYNGVEIFHELGAKIIAVTLGSKGTLISNGHNLEMIPSIKITSIDSTGAGDAFVGAALYKFCQVENPKSIAHDFDNLKEIIFFANKVGAIVCTKLGAISAIPTLIEVEMVV